MQVSNSHAPRSTISQAETFSVVVRLFHKRGPHLLSSELLCDGNSNMPCLSDDDLSRRRLLSKKFWLVIRMVPDQTMTGRLAHQACNFVLHSSTV